MDDGKATELQVTVTRLKTREAIVMPMHRKISLISLVIVIGFAAISANAILINSKYDHHGGVAWRTDLVEAQRVAEEKDRPVLVYFWMENCASCEEFERRLQTADAGPELEKFVLVTVRAPKQQELASRYGVNKTPTLVAVSADDKWVTRIIPPETESLPKRLDRVYEKWKQEYDR